MSDTGSFLDPGEDLEADLGLMEAIRASRAMFEQEIVEIADPLRPEVENFGTVDKGDFTMLLRCDGAYRLAEFYYALKAYGLNTGDKVQSLGLLHNDYMNETIEDSDKLARLGLTKSAIEHERNAVWFSEPGLETLKANFDKYQGFDQYDLQRLMRPLMSRDTCRKVVGVMGQTDLLTRIPMQTQSMLFRSTGTLEELYGKHLRAIRTSTQG